jgi:hypothetical protein
VNLSFLNEPFSKDNFQISFFWLEIMEHDVFLLLKLITNSMITIFECHISNTVVAVHHLLYDAILTWLYVGPIPIGIGQLRILTKLRLDDNNLTGHCFVICCFRVEVKLPNKAVTLFWLDFL